ncbi:unnamed protein product [Phytophthora fragariaefolia]|uniref:Unnamed protein product n=1 Tax=Phytophthora fragariaefolia TaxID=1490495 RepID=A0A9W6XMM9_9STRA|nr:unnamed protein product [Phytophthora fragariaefolia]
MSFPSGTSISTLPDTGYAPDNDVSLEHVPHDSGDSLVHLATREADASLLQSPQARSSAVNAISQSMSELRALVQDIDQRVYRCCDDIDSGWAEPTLLGNYGATFAVSMAEWPHSSGGCRSDWSPVASGGRPNTKSILMDCQHTEGTGKLASGAAACGEDLTR